MKWNIVFVLVLFFIAFGTTTAYDQIESFPTEILDLEAPQDYGVDQEENQVFRYESFINFITTG